MFPLYNKQRCDSALKQPAQLAIDHNSNGLLQLVDRSSQNRGEHLHLSDSEIQLTALTEQ